MTADVALPVRQKALLRCTLHALVGCALCLASGCEGDSLRESPDDGDEDQTRTVTMSDAGWLTDVTAEWGTEFTTRTGARGELHMPEIMGGGVAVLDFDNDDDLDLYFINGQDDPNRANTGVNRLYRQDSPGRFTDVTESSGLGDPGYGMGCAVGEIDNDGDLNLVVSNIECAARILRNDAPRKGHWLRVEAMNAALNRLDIGAVVTVRAGERAWAGRVDCGSSYLTSNDPRVHFGLGEVQNIDSIEVTWADGTTERFPGSTVDAAVRVERGGDTPVVNEP